MKSEKYWKQLSEEREKYIQSGADETAKRMVRLYDKAASDINEQIKKMFDRFVKTSGLTDEEAERYISKTQSDAEIRKLKILLEKTEGAAQKREIKNKITAAAYKSRMTRKEAVLNNIYVLTKNLANEEIERTKALYSKTVKESYYRTVFDVFKGVSAGADFTKLDEKAINKMINVKWYGKNFSERIWKNTDLLASAAQDVISSGIATGKTYMQMSKEIEELGLGSAKASVRLVRTQVSYFRGRSELQAYREAGFEKYKFVASLKEKGTCDKCGGLDGKVFDIDDARAGKNYNPIHPNCRCTTIAYFGKSTGKRIAQSDDKSYRVPSDMTYKEWKKNYVDNSAESGIMKTENGRMVANDVHKIGKIDIEKYRCVTKDIKTDEVIITDKQIQHIRERHPDDYERFGGYFEHIINHPDYIIEANKPNTALLLKSIETNGEQFKLVLRLITSADNPEFKNSIITFMKIDQKEWNRLVKNKKILYKSE